MSFTYDAVNLAGIGRRGDGFKIFGTAERDYAGGSVASAGDINGDGFDDLIVGAVGFDPGGRLAAGAAFVIFGKVGGFDPTIQISAVALGQGGFVIEGEARGDNAGRSVAAAGDINGDGFDDLIIGASSADAAGNAKFNAGAAYVVFGKANGFGDSIDLAEVAQGQGGFVVQGEDAGDVAGYSVASAGDVNGDGLDDLIIGASSADSTGNTKTYAGAAYVVFGKASGFGASIDLAAVAEGRGGFVIQGEDAGDRAGYSVASAGDVNADGYDDLIVGAPGNDAGGSGYAGAAYVVFGRADGFGAAIDLAAVALGEGGFVVRGDVSDERGFGDYAGRSVAAAGDVNGDGIDDIVIGAIFADGADDAKEAAGAAYVVFGQATGFGASIDLAAVALGQGGFVIHGAERFDFAGASVTLAGDINGDGFGDLLVGADNADGANGTSSVGAAFLVFGKPGGFGAAIDLADVALGLGGFVFRGANFDDRAGDAVAGAGDLNGDGFDDLIIGAKDADRGAGVSYVFFGRDFGGGPATATLAIAGTVATAAEGNAGTTVLTFTVTRQGALGIAASADYAVTGSGAAPANAADFAGGVLPTGTVSFAAGEVTQTITILVAADTLFEPEETFTVTLSAPAPAAGTAITSPTAIGTIRNDDPRTITGTAAGETLRGGAAPEILSALGGNDVVLGRTGNDVLDGGDGNDSLLGDSGDDTLLGGLGADTLVGGKGSDVLTGRGGSDLFVFLTRADGIDTITDFNAAFDQILVDSSGFGGNLAPGALAAANFAANAAGVATGAAPQFVYDTDSGALFWDRDGTGAGAAVQIAILTGASTLDATDFVVVA